jgi:microcin C transport system permease protein
MENLQYILRRLLLVIPTFFGITIICFALCQFVPGGPVEQAMLHMRGTSGGAEGGGASGGGAISEGQREALVEYFGFDKPLPVRYWDWLVHKRMGLNQYSYRYSNKTAWELIRERIPVSLTFGITGFLLSYLVCIPLGIAKALRHGKPFDFISSVVVLSGYAIPAFAFGMLLKMLFCGTSDQFWDLFPLAGFHSENYELLSLTGKAKDLFMHMFLPVLCYMIGSFAVLTLLMKNSLLEQINQDYVRTVLAKGCSMRRAVWKHAVRNSLIPIATGFGEIIMIFFAGSVLIERVFNIRGMGLLSYEAVLSRDYSVFMAILGLTALLGLLGRILSDISYMIIDPRITFKK